VSGTTKLEGVTWRTGDATNPEEVAKVLAEGGFSAMIHAIGAALSQRRFPRG